ncbi:hypothetical protein R1flu_010650 [Riccia fluitans]|uniref:Uncharacterized protein n=1 Tax=Riccia fluitans TaxID=41844 RepID=A0ABD1Z5K7_9MARC
MCPLGQSPQAKSKGKGSEGNGRIQSRFILLLGLVRKVGGNDIGKTNVLVDSHTVSWGREEEKKEEQDEGSAKVSVLRMTVRSSARALVDEIRWYCCGTADVLAFTDLAINQEKHF